MPSVELHAERPWLCLLDQFLAQPGGPLISSHMVAFQERLVVFLSGRELVSASDRSGNFAVLDMSAGGIVKRLKGARTFRIRWRLARTGCALCRVALTARCGSETRQAV
jgi:hypothetical protein